MEILVVLSVFAPLTGCVAFYSLFERKVMAEVQFRMGPNKVLVMGLTQPFSDGLKLMSKQEELPYRSEMWLYTVSPLISFITPLLVWMLLPLDWLSIEWNDGFVLVLIFFSITIYSLMIMGWSSNSKYASLGVTRAICQSISYEVGLTLVVCTLIVLLGKFSLVNCVQAQSTIWFGFPLAGLMGIMVVCGTAESDRAPFDLPESESELVSGYHVEYGGFSYTMTYLGEMLSMLWMCQMISLMFGGCSPFSWLTMVMLMTLIRTILPRLRFDEMTSLFWIRVLPLGLGFSQTFLTLVSCF